MRIVISLVFWVAVARWIQAEVEMLTPQAAPYIERFFESLQLPTHDQWPELLETLQTYINTL